jgi:hypothetical protein
MGKIHLSICLVILLKSKGSSANQGTQFNISNISHLILSPKECFSINPYPANVEKSVNL